MADKITLTDLSTFVNDTTAVAAVNANNSSITTAFDNTLSRDGTSPNQMLASLDMNSQQIINLPSPGTPNSPLRLIDGMNGTVTFIPGGSNGQIQYNNGGTVVGGFGNWSGTNLSFTGSLTLNGSTSGSSTIGVQSVAGTSLFTLPVGNGSSGQVLVTNGAGQTSWSTATITAGNTPTSGFTAGQLFYSDGSLIQAMSGTSWSNANRALTITGATVTANNPILNLTQTWNNAAVSFTGIKLNVTNTASLNGRLIDLQNTGASQFSVDLNGAIYPNSYRCNLNPANFYDGNSLQYMSGTGTTNPVVTVGQAGSHPSTIQIYNTADQVPFSTNYETATLDWVTTSNTFTIGTAHGGTGSVRGMNIRPEGILDLGSSNTGVVQISTNASEFIVSSGGAIRNRSDIQTRGYMLGSSDDVHWWRDGGAGLCGFGNGAGNTGEYRFYNVYDATNYERALVGWQQNTNVFTIGTQKGGTGLSRNMYIAALSGNQTIYLGSGGAAYWGFDPQGGALNFASGASVYIAFCNTGGFTLTGSPSNQDSSISRAAAKVIKFGDGAINSNGWIQWAGQARVTADVPFTSTTTLGTVTGLSVALQAGRTYSFDVYLSFTDAAAGGIKAAIATSDTLTATAIEYDGWIIDSGANGIKGNTQATALATTVASSTTTGTAGVVLIKGTITVNVAGTLIVQAAQNTSSGTATTIKRGSYMIVHDMP